MEMGFIFEQLFSNILNVEAQPRDRKSYLVVIFIEADWRKYASVI